VSLAAQGTALPAGMLNYLLTMSSTSHGQERAVWQESVQETHQ